MAGPVAVEISWAVHGFLVSAQIVILTAIDRYTALVFSVAALRAARVTCRRYLLCIHMTSHLDLWNYLESEV